jgi:hypothetical protein
MMMKMLMLMLMLKLKLMPNEAKNAKAEIGMATS